MKINKTIIKIPRVSNQRCTVQTKNISPSLVYRSPRHCYARRHKRLASPTYRYRPRIHSACTSPSTTTSATTAAAAVATITDYNNCEEPRRPLTESTKSTGRPAESPPPPPPPDVVSRTWLGDRLHKHLLLVTGQVYHEFIDECSIAAQASDLRDLDSILRPSGGANDDFVLVQVGTGWRLDVRLLDMLVDRLGNVSVYADKRYYSETMNKHCRNIGAGCTLLANLVPVLEQFESLGGGRGGDDGAMYDPDWIPAPALPPLPRNITGSTDKQIEHLTWRLCVRDRRRNLYYKLGDDSSSSLSRLRYSTRFKFSSPPDNPSSLPRPYSR